MAASAAIVPRDGLALSVGRVLDTPELARLVEDLAALRRSPRVRPGYTTRSLLGACIVKSLYGLSTWAQVARLIGEHPGLQAVLGEAPSQWACYRFSRKLAAHRDLRESCARGLLEKLRATDPELGADVAVDSTDIPAYANGQKYRYRGGPERTSWSDPDASWGHRSAVSTRRGGGFYGYKLHLVVCTRTDLPLGWEVRTGKEADMRIVGPLLKQLSERGIRPASVAMDRGYDYRSVYQACQDRGALPVVAARRNSGTGEGPIDRGSNTFKRLYRARSSVEREFGRLKHHLGLAPLRVRRLERVRLHADLCLLTRLALAAANS